jgi:LPS-assembly protein
VRTLPRVILCISFLVAFCVRLGAVGPQLTADSLSYDIQNHQRKAVGNAVFTHDGTTLEADEIILDDSTRTAHAIGNVRVTRATFRIVTHELSYDLTEKSFRCSEFRAGYPPIFLEGKSAYGKADKVELKDVIAYMGDPADKASPTVAAEKMILSTGNRVLSVGMKPGIGKFKFFRIPQIDGTIRKLPKTDTNVALGIKDNLGAFVSTTVLYPVNENLYLGGNFDFYSKRGFLYGPATKYEGKTGNVETTGSVNTGIIHDRGQLGYDYFADSIPQDRWFVQERSKTVISDTVRVTSYINLFSDPDVMRDFRPDFYVGNQYPDNFIEVTSPIGEDVVLSALTRFANPGNEYAVIQRLPEIRFDYLTNPLPFLGLYQTGYFTVAKTDYTVDDTHYENSRVHAYYGLSRMFAPLPWLSITPKTGGFVGYYDKAWNIDDDTITEIGSATHYIGEMGVDVVGDFYSQWEYKNRMWNIDGLRHIVRPVVYWRKYATAGDNEWASVDVDDSVDPIQMPSIDLRDLEGNDYYYLYNPHFVRVGLENLLHTRDGATSRELAAFNIYHDSVFTDHTLDRAYAQLSLSPSNFLRFSFENGVDIEPLGSKWYRSRLTLKSAELWSVNFFADYYENNYEAYSVTYFYQLTRDFGVETHVGYDADEGEFNRLSLSVYQRVGAFWRIRYRIGYNKEDLREDSFNLSIAIAGMNF